MKTSLQMKKHIEIDTFFSSKSSDFLFSLELLFFFFFYIIIRDLFIYCIIAYLVNV